MTIFGTPIRQGETAPLQAFVPEGQAVPIPVEKLDHAAATVDEDEERSGQGVRPQVGTDDAAEAVEGFAHIADAAVQIDTGGRGQAEHRFPLSASTTARRVEGSNPRSTSMQSLPPRRMQMPESFRVDPWGAAQRKPPAEDCCSLSLRRQV